MYECTPIQVYVCLSVSLTANLLHDEGAKAIADAVKVNQALTTLQ